MDLSLVRPKALKSGDTVVIIAPAGPVEDRDDLRRGVDALEKMGFRVQYDERIFSSLRYLAGPDRERAEELMRAFEAPEVHAVLALRAGYGSSRLVPFLDMERLRRFPKIFMGFSDVTTLHMLFRKQLGWVTFHGPMATSEALGNITPEARNHILRLWTDPDYLPTLSFPTIKTWVPGTAEGELAGGCLSLVVAGLGTGYEIETDGKILFLEDLGEPPYRIDRMLTQMQLSGKLHKIAGMLLGSFQDCISDKPGQSIDETFQEFADRMQVPVMTGFPAGHGKQNWVLPLGTRIRLDASRGAIDFLEPSVLPR